ncbi:hypothetical protein Tco_0616502 [Tanacetum coccineum]
MPCHMNYFLKMVHDRSEGFGIGEVVLSTFDVLQRFGFFLQMGFTLILATIDGLDVDEPFSGSTTIHSNTLHPSSSPVKTSDNLEEFGDELTLLDSFPPVNDDSTLEKDVHEENF